MNKALSNDDLHKYIKEVENNGLNMYLIEDLTPNTHIEEIFADAGHTIFFYNNGDDTNQNGHWLTCLRNRQGDYYWMDSFGESPDHYDKNIFKCLSRNKKNGVKALHINKTSLQNKNSQTCGRYGIIFSSLNKAGMNPEQMVDFLKEGGKKFGSVDKYILHLFDE